MTELLPCPFCGRSPVLKQTGETNYWWIGCEISLGQHGCGVGHSRYDKDEVIQLWNTRPNLPTGTEAAVCRDITARQAKGIAKYGQTVADNPIKLREWLQHLYEEQLDACIYTKRAIEEIDKK
jgi:Restriction alleviation protein Lar